MKQKTLVSALEAIDYQNDLFFQELTALVKETRNLSKAEFQKPETMERYAKLANYYTDGKILFVGDAKRFFALWFDMRKATNDLSAVDLISQKNKEDEIHDIVSNKKYLVDGGVDLKTGRLKGDFRYLPCVIGLPQVWFASTTFTDEELAAFILHEIGHHLSFMEYVQRTTIANFALLEITNKWRKASGSSDRRQILITVKDYLRLTDADIRSLEEISSTEGVSVAVMTAYMNRLQSVTGNNIYDLNCFEFLADQYAQRLGAGLALSVGLEKMERLSIFARERSADLGLAVAKYSLMLGISMANPIFFAILVMGLNSALAVYGDTAPAYDRPVNRLRRIRQQMIASLKSDQTPDELKAQLREEIEKFDQAITLGEERESVFRFVLNKLSPISRKRFSQEKLAKELEQMANNDLFLKAYDLKNI